MSIQGHSISNQPSILKFLITTSHILLIFAYYICGCEIRKLCNFEITSSGSNVMVIRICHLYLKIGVNGLGTFEIALLYCVLTSMKIGTHGIYDMPILTMLVLTYDKQIQGHGNLNYPKSASHNQYSVAIFRVWLSYLANKEVLLEHSYHEPTLRQNLT